MKNSFFSKFSVIILIICFSCNKNYRKINYKRSSCIGYQNIFLTKKQKKLQGSVSFSGVTTFKKNFGKEFGEEVLLYFKKGQNSFGELLDDEINDEDLLKNIRIKNYHFIIATDIKIAKIFDVPILHLPQGGWEIESDYLFMIKNLHIKKVYKDICEEEIISLLKSGEL